MKTGQLNAVSQDIVNLIYSILLDITRFTDHSYTALNGLTNSPKLISEISSLKSRLWTQ